MSTDGSRAVLVRAQSIDGIAVKRCALCDELGLSKGRGVSNPNKVLVVVANVYVDGRWDRVETWHPGCYDTAGRPYGEPVPRHRFTPGRAPRVRDLRFDPASPDDLELPDDDPTTTQPEKGVSDAVRELEELDPITPERRGPEGTTSQDGDRPADGPTTEPETPAVDLAAEDDGAALRVLAVADDAGATPAKEVGATPAGEERTVAKKTCWCGRPVNENGTHRGVHRGQSPRQIREDRRGGGSARKKPAPAKEPAVQAEPVVTAHANGEGTTVDLTVDFDRNLLDEILQEARLLFERLGKAEVDVYANGDHVGTMKPVRSIELTVNGVVVATTGGAS